MQLNRIVFNRAERPAEERVPVYSGNELLQKVTAKHWCHENKHKDFCFLFFCLRTSSFQTPPKSLMCLIGEVLSPPLALNFCFVCRMTYQSHKGRKSSREQLEQLWDPVVSPWRRPADLSRRPNLWRQARLVTATCDFCFYWSRSCRASSADEWKCFLFSLSQKDKKENATGDKKIVAFLVWMKEIQRNRRFSGKADGKWVIKPTDPDRNLIFQFEPFLCEKVV